MSELTRHFRYPGAVQLTTVPTFESIIPQVGGQVLSGFVTPPQTGLYTFYLASANAAELWLSSDTRPENAVKISEEPGANTRRNWSGYGTTSHISAPIELKQGSWYFVRAIHKAGLGSSHLGVAWQLPGAEAPADGSAPISGEYLTWLLPDNGPTLGIVTSTAGRWLLTVHPSGTASLMLEASTDLVQWASVNANLSSGELDLLALEPSSNANRFFRLRKE